jgi:hypothetical protein
VNLRRRQQAEYVHPPPPPGVPVGLWQSPGYVTTGQDLPPQREFRDPKEYFVALESFMVGVHYFEKDKWIRKDYPGAAKVAREHPELLRPASREEV